jgi:hypothetical protein
MPRFKNLRWSMKGFMKTLSCEFAPLELDRANELLEIINGAAEEKEAVLIEPDDRGVVGAAPAELVSPNENVNGLARYQRHY